MISENVSFWFFCDVTVPWLFFKSKVIEFNAIITSRIYEQNKVKKPPTIKRCPDVFGFNFQLFDKIRRSNSTEYSISKIYFQFLKTNSNKETAVLTFIDFAFFSAENLFFSSFDQTCGNNTQHSTWQAKQACFCYTEMLLRRARALNCCLAQLLPCTAAIHSTMNQILRKITEVYSWTLESIFSYSSLYYKKILDMTIINIIPMLFGNQ